jgi:hypothetical protein
MEAVDRTRLRRDEDDRWVSFAVRQLADIERDERRVSVRLELTRRGLEARKRESEDYEQHDWVPLSRNSTPRFVAASWTCPIGLSGSRREDRDGC